MLDHLVGKPSANWKRTQVILTLIFGVWVLLKGKTGHLPRLIRKLNHVSAGSSPWKITLGSWMAHYLIQNLFLLVGLNAPEPQARLYKRNFYRATWILTALDAGFFTAMPLRPAWLRHTCSILFTLYYLVFADAAEERVRRVRATMSIDQIRLSWEKAANNPILAWSSKLLRPKITMHKVMHVDRPSPYLPPTEFHFFYSGSPESLAQQTTVLLQYPGGGFVSMPPPCHEDALYAWAKQTGLPVVSVNYKKAPEYPYPWAVHECFDFYVSLIQQRGRFLGLSGDKDIKVVVVGDSAGGNLAAAVTLKLLDHNKLLKEEAEDDEDITSKLLPMPEGLVLIYPALDFEMTCWMTTGQLSLIRSESTTKMIRSKSLMSLLESKDHLSHASPLSVVPDVDKKKPSPWKRALGMTPVDGANTSKENASSEKKHVRDRIQELSEVKTDWESSRLAMTSRMSFFNDRILTAEMMRAMAILYLGPHAHPDFESDYLLSPVVAPFELLAEFPKTYMMCGEKDPFVDDTVIFGGRIRQAKQQRRREEQRDDDDPVLGDHTVKVKFLEGMSHAFLQMMAFLPEAKHATQTIGDWVLEIAEGRPSADTFSDSDSARSGSPVHEQQQQQQQWLAVPSINGYPRSLDQQQPGIAKAVVAATSHLDHIVTSEKDLLSRRKTALVSELFVQNVQQ